MASATFSTNPALTIPELHGYSIQALFGQEGLEDNFRIWVATRAEIGTKRAHVWNFPEAKGTDEVARPVAALQIVISDAEILYKFADVTLQNRRRLVNGSERYSVFEFSYVDQLKFKNGKNPIDVSNAKFTTKGVAHHSKQTALLPGSTTPKALLGVEGYQDAQAATVIRLVSHRSKENSWLDLLNTQNWKKKVTERLKWNFSLNNDKIEIDGAKDDMTVIHYRETYGVFNLIPNPVLRGYTEPDLTGHCLTMPFESTRPSAPWHFLDSQTTGEDQKKFAQLTQQSFVETVTIRLGTGRYHHLDLG